MPAEGSSPRRIELRQIARRYGRGDIMIQTGRVIGMAEYERRREAVLRYSF